jgi:hypothetical protein
MTDYVASVYAAIDAKVHQHLDFGGFMSEVPTDRMVSWFDKNAPLWPHAHSWQYPIKESPTWVLVTPQAPGADEDDLAACSMEPADSVLVTPMAPAAPRVAELWEPVPAELALGMGMVIGREGVHFRSIAESSGALHLQHDAEANAVAIYGPSEEAVQRAATLLRERYAACARALANHPRMQEPPLPAHEPKRAAHWTEVAAAAAAKHGLVAQYVTEFGEEQLAEVTEDGKMSYVGRVVLKKSEPLFTAASALSQGMDDYFAAGTRTIKWGSRIMFTELDDEHMLAYVPYALRSTCTSSVPLGARLVHVRRPYEYSRYFRASVPPWDEQAVKRTLRVVTAAGCCTDSIYNTLSSVLEDACGVLLLSLPTSAEGGGVEYSILHAPDVEVDEDALRDAVMCDVDLFGKVLEVTLL